ncbi:MAG: glycosyltransferase family 39 protein, partial [Balneolaceae bacterium]|nr:glycosyltransferase family 39 protein [Balneolaceae bacterium]
TSNSSMWTDELNIAVNIQSQSISSLITESLDYNAVAPVGFLAILKGVTSLFGDHDWAYRMIPWILSIVGLLFFWRICRMYLKGIKLFGVLALFAVSIPLIAYAGHAKQYSGDVAVAVFLVWSCLYLIRGKPNNEAAWYIGLGGALGILLSLPAVPLAALLIVILFISHYQGAAQFSRADLIIVGACWSFSALLGFAYAQFVVEGAVRSDMITFWTNGFPPNDSVLSYIGWFPQAVHETMGHFIFFDPQAAPPVISLFPVLLIVLSVFGIYYVLKTKRTEALILLAPFLTGLILAIAGILPFRHRLALYALWPLLFFGFMGLHSIQKWGTQTALKYITNGLALVMAVPMILILLTFGSPPYISQPSQPVLEKVKELKKPGDILFVYCKSNLALQFYGPKVGIYDWESSKCYDKAESFREEIQKFDGNERVWFFYTQWNPEQPFPDSIRVYFDEMGKQIDHIPDPYGGTKMREATAYLYDLSN